MILEVCCSNISSVRNAHKAKIDRIELCSQLSVGGITPSYGFTKTALEESIEVHALIRPREGDFCYTEKELKIIYRDIEIMHDLGCQGIVVGVLHKDLTMNENAIKNIIKLSKGMEITFHRAIDVAKYPMKILEKLIELGVNRVLSSGQQPNALEGLAYLKKMNQISRGRIEIMPGSGINSSNCIQFKNAGFSSIHFSAFKKIVNKNGSCATPNLFEAHLGESDLKEILKIKEQLALL
ncbi:MAG: copper homeostasis protein CutC [Flavobacteriaceae bacterium]|nr:copper homeostasis protein CutC [Flavobacteriaceae bacterium]MCY4266531.1 copper homeostasis protein CutC [Flavobacteriaceae bacterium]MCY4299831.1 copper homeostasis protein CutC [Flavobacteriaceae bacterium]